MRSLNRVLALVLGLALVAFAVVFTVEVVAAFVGSAPVLVHWHPAYTHGEHDTWGSAGVRATAIVVAAVGLVLLVVQLRPRRPDTLTLEQQTDGITTGITRPGVRTALAAAATGVDGVTKAHVRLRRHRARVTATTYAGDVEALDPLREKVRSAVDARLAGMQLRRPPRIRLTVRTTGGQS